MSSTRLTLPKYVFTQRFHRGRGALSPIKLLSPALFLEPHRGNRTPAAHWETLSPRGGRSATDVITLEFLESTQRCLCIAGEAGMGKSVSVRRAQWVISDGESGRLAILLQHKDFDSAALAADDNGAAMRTILATRLRKDIVTSAGATEHRQIPSIDECKACIGYHLSADRLVVLVDGLDHLRGGTESAAFRQIKGFLDASVHSPPRLILSSRPFALRDWLESLELVEHTTLCQPAYFDASDQRDYLGVELFNALRGLDAELMRIPRALQRIREGRTPVADGVLSFASAADLYLHATHHLLEVGFKGRMGTQTAFTALSVVACEMLLQDKITGVSYEDVDQGFLLDTFNHNHGILRSHFKNEFEFRDALQRIHKVNEGFEYALVEPCQESAEITWRDLTIRDYLAALWMLRYGPALDRFIDKCGAFLEPFTPSDSPVYWVWRFLVDASFEGPTEGPWMKADPVLWSKMTKSVFASWKRANDSAEVWNASELLVRILDRVVTLPENGDSGELSRDVRHRYADACMALADKERDAVMGMLNDFIDLPGEIGMSVKAFPVTNREYGLYRRSHRFAEADADKPVTGVSSWDAIAFCRWLTIAAGATTTAVCRLPTAEEWCCACRAGSESMFARIPRKGARDAIFEDLDEYGAAAHFACGRGTDGYRARQAAVANAWGLLDMHGNVSEWTSSVLVSDPALRLCLGGSWKACDAANLQADAAVGQQVPPGAAFDDVGFRPWRVEVSTSSGEQRP